MMDAAGMGYVLKLFITMKQTYILICLAICTGFLLTGCKSQKKSAEEPVIPASGFSAVSLAESNNHFALDLFKQIHPRSDNLIFSPYSISTVLAMCYSGADGKTAEQMSEVLYFPPSDQLEPASKELKKHRGKTGFS